MPISLEYLSWLEALGLFGLLSAPIVLLGVRSLAGLGPVRRWVALGARLLVLLLMVLILSGARWEKVNRKVEVIVLRDVSESTLNVRDYPGKSLAESVDDYLRVIARSKQKQADDRIGVISFDSTAVIDAVPNTQLALDARPIRDPGSGTDVASAIQLALATLGKDAMHRLVLMWDGNANQGDLDAALSAAAAAGVPIDVMPLRYDVQNEVLLERFVAPVWKRENEPFSLDLILRSTNAVPVTGRISVLHQGVPMDLDDATPGLQATREVTLAPGLNRETIRVPPLESAGVHQFRAVIEAPNVTAEVRGAPGGVVAGDTLVQNNVASAFTFVRGKGKLLLIDNTPEQQGEVLRRALEEEGIAIDPDRSTIDQFPSSLVELQNYDAVILVNVPRGAGGLSEDQQRMLASYVHDMGGGLVMVGGEDAFGAGGWQGSRLEEVLPVNMDLPARREIAKGALALVMHSCEMPQGNYWGEQCAIKAVETLSSRDEVGVISYAWRGPAGGGSQWDYPLSEKGDGSRVIAAIKNMQLGDMPSFDDSLDVALNGTPSHPGLLKSDARQKHIIIISDGDPQPPNPALVRQAVENKITISTITVFPHMGDADGLPLVMKDLARATRGRAYGPINNNPGQLPQIFIKEATVVRRSLIYEDRRGIPLKLQDAASELIKGIGELPPIYGMVLTSRKQNPQIEVPLVAGRNNDPLLAYWQTGLGRSAVFTSDAHNRWLAGWVGGAMYNKFWSQVVRAVARPPMSSDFDVQTVQTGNKGKVIVEALGKDNQFLSFMSMTANIAGPDPSARPQTVRLTQTGPGVYEGEFDAPDPGNYVALINYRGGAGGSSGILLGGMVVNTSPELRDLQSNETMIERVRVATGGRLVQPFNPDSADFFTRDSLRPSISPQPIWDRLLMVLLGAILMDVSIRRIAWDLPAMKRAAGRWVRSFTTTRQVETRGALDALRKVRDDQSLAREDAGVAASVAVEESDDPRPDPARKFDAPRVEGDITQVVGGATDKPIPSAPKSKDPPKGQQPERTDSLGGLLAAKKRAREQMDRKEDD